LLRFTLGDNNFFTEEEKHVTNRDIKAQLRRNAKRMGL
jgi:hypothetical protein